MLFKKLNSVWLLALLLFSSSAGWPCSDYVHLWRPVVEERTSMCGAEGIASFLHELVSDKLPPGSGDHWHVGLSPDSTVSASFSIELKRAVSLLDPEKFSWTDSGSPFDGEQSAATIWLDFVNPERLVYIWRDENKPPFAMFRTGELDTARVRILAMTADRKILLIDELPYLFLLESDFMLPTWCSAGGAWFRRVSLKTAGMLQRHEWTLSEPADNESVNQTPSDTKRFYFGEASSGNTQIISNY